MRKTTAHTHKVVFGKRVEGCPRCTELDNGADPITWRNNRRALESAQRLIDIARHDCRERGCGYVCTAFES